MALLSEKRREAINSWRRKICSQAFDVNLSTGFVFFWKVIDLQSNVFQLLRILVLINLVAQVLFLLFALVEIATDMS